MTGGVTRENFAGCVFSRLTVIGEVERGRNWSRRMLARCDCGAIRIVRLGNLKSGAVKSCGCARGTHQHAKARTPEYNAWVAMNQRCVNPKNPRWADYGGRGITVCAEWHVSFEAFLRDMGPRPTSQHSIDRRDNNLGYDPGNCRWATSAEQAANKRHQKIRKDAGVPRGPR